MHTKAIVCAIAALSMGFSSSIFAQQDKDVRSDQANREEHRAKEQPRDQERRRAEQPQPREERAVAPRRNQDSRQNESERSREWQHRRSEGERAHSGREGASRHNFNRGDHLPMEYRDRHYVVDDWRGHRLSAPPRGYHWVQADGDFLLVAITTGVIVSILLNQ